MSDEIKPPDQTEEAAILAGPTPGAVQSWRDEEPGRKMYGTTGFVSVVPDDAYDGANLPTDRRKAAVSNLRNMLADTGLAPVEASQLLNRSGVVRAEGRTADQQRKEARTILARTFGADDVDAVLRDVTKLTKRDPRFHTWLNRKGLGNDGETLVTLARAARSQRAAGRLK